MARLADADPLALLVPAVSADQRVADVLGVPLDRLPDHVSDRNEPPYPHIKMTDPPGSDLGLRNLMAPLIQVEVHGDMDGSHGKPLLRNVLYTVLEVLAEYPDRPQARPVITAVTSSGGGGWAPEPTDQPRYLATVTVYIHP